MNKQALTAVFEDMKDEGGSRIYRIAEALAPRTGDGAPAVDAEFIGQQYVDTTAGEMYFSVTIGNGAADWEQVTKVV